jgi:hypothetical protein
MRVYYTLRRYEVTQVQTLIGREEGETSRGGYPQYITVGDCQQTYRATARRLRELKESSEGSEKTVGRHLGV